jgi:hypothetical protein
MARFMGHWPKNFNLLSQGVFGASAGGVWEDGFDEQLFCFLFPHSSSFCYWIMKKMEQKQRNISN